MPRPWLRARAVLTAAVLLFIHVRGWAGEIPCPRHSAGEHAAASHQHSHASHDAHGPGKTSRTGDPCTCMDHCPACQSAALVPRTPALPESTFVVSSGRVALPSGLLAPARVDHQLPFSTAPPA
jgi:hypothetical protein